MAGNLGVTRHFLHAVRGALPAELVRFNPGWTRIAVNGDALRSRRSYRSRRRWWSDSSRRSSRHVRIRSRRSRTVDVRRRGPAGASGCGARSSSAEVALALVLLVGTGLMVRSFIGLIETDQGYAVKQALTMQLTLPGARYETDAKMAAFYTTLLDRVRERPGVVRAAMTSSPPPDWSDNSTRFILEGEPKPQRGDPAHRERLRVVSDGYFATLGIPVKRGREFDRHDDKTSPNVAIVSEAFARRYWPGQDAIGKRISTLADSMSLTTIIGVVGDARHNPNIGREPLAPVVYIPVTQAPWSTMTLVVRTAGDPAASAHRRAESHRVDRPRAGRGQRAHARAHAVVITVSAAAHGRDAERVRRHRAAAGGDRHLRCDVATP